jgi:transposase
VSVYGDYAQADSEGLRQLHGHSKGHRPDLKQLIFGLVVSGDGGVPLLGQVHEGNQSDYRTHCWQLPQLRQVVPNLAQSTLVYDGKFFDARTLGLAYSQGVHWISLVPASIHQRGELARRVLEEDRPLAVLRRKPGRHKGEEQVFRGTSVVEQIEIEGPREEGKEGEAPPN